MHLKSNLFIERGLLQLKKNLMGSYAIASISLEGQCDTLKIGVTLKG